MSDYIEWTRGMSGVARSHRFLARPGRLRAVILICVLVAATATTNVVLGVTCPAGGFSPSPQSCDSTYCRPDGSGAPFAWLSPTGAVDRTWQVRRAIRSPNSSSYPVLPTGSYPGCRFSFPADSPAGSATLRVEGRRVLVDYDAPNYYCFDDGAWPIGYCNCGGIIDCTSNRLVLNVAGWPVRQTWIYFDHGTWDTGWDLPCPGTAEVEAVLLYVRSGTTATPYSSGVQIRGTSEPCALPDRGSCPAGTSVGLPINVGSGNVTATQPLFTLGQDPLPLFFNLTYHSSAPMFPGLVSSPVGTGWTHPFAQTLRSEDGTGNRLYHITDEGLEAEYARIAPATTWVAVNPGGLHGTVSLVGSEYWLTDLNGTVTKFDVSTGNWLSTTDRWSNSIRGTYTSGQLTKITDPAGREVTLAYTTGQVTVTLPGSKVWRLVLGANGTLTQIFDPMHSGTTPWRKLAYQNDLIGSLRLLTSVKDEADQELEAHTYETTTDRGLTSSQAGGTRSNVTISYTGDTTRTVTHTIDGDEQETATYTLIYSRGRWLPTQINGPCTSCGDSTSDIRTFEYDYDNHVVVRKDGSGAELAETRFTYDASGMLLTRTEAFGKTEERTTSYSYEYASGTPGTPVGGPAWPSFVTKVEEASVVKPSEKKATTYSWNATGTAERTLQTKVSGYKLATDPARTDLVTTTAFDAFHRRTSVTGPSTNQKTTFAYFYDSAALNDRRRLKTVSVYTSAAGHLDTGHSDYDVFGTAKKVVDPNLVETARVTDDVGRVTSVTSQAVAGDPNEASTYTTTYEYDLRDRLVKVTHPLGNQVQYVYENGTNRLTDTIRADSSANQRERLHLTLNVIGGKTAEAAQSCDDVTPSSACSSWVTKRNETFEYNTSNRLSSVVHPGSSPAPRIDYTYDSRGNLKTVKDERHTTANTTYTYDLLNRLKTVTQKLIGAQDDQIATGYSYDTQDNLKSVADPNNNVTTYEYDDFRRLQKQISPVTGTTNYSYDLTTNQEVTTDARGAITTRTYDAASRLLSASSVMAGRADEVVSYAYDVGDPRQYLNGRLVSMTDPTGRTLYTYDRRGLVKSERKSVLSATYETSYAYDANGNRTAVNYPRSTPPQPGNVVTYSFDFADRPYSATGSAATYVSGATYMPFGPLAQLNMGNGLTRTVTFDQRYQPSTLILDGGGTKADYTYGKDAGGNILSITDNLNSGYSRTDFQYDDLNRLTKADAGSALWGTETSYTYDSLGSMKSLTLGTRTATFFYLPTGTETLPVLEKVRENGVDRAVTYDSNRNETGLGTQVFSYSPRNYLQSAADRAVANESFYYMYDGRGLRTATVDTKAGASIVVTNVSPGAASATTGSMTITVDGFPFTNAPPSPSTVFVGGAALTTTYVSPTRLTATISPSSLGAGARYDITVRQGAVSSNAFPFLVEFADVPSTSGFYSFVNTLFLNGITTGCTGGNFCPTGVVTRAQMAVFILKSIFGSSYAPPACSAQLFTDVPCGHWADKWINDFATKGYTSGCGAGAYCPENPVKRDEMAVFLLKGVHGSTYSPPVGTAQVFADVQPGHWAYDWINQFVREGITAGCGGGNYCPGNPITRAEMAVFLTKAFKLRPAGTTSPASSHRFHLYDPEYHLLTETEYQTTAAPLPMYEYVWFGGQLVAQEVVGSGRSFITTDHLGTPFLVTGPSPDKATLWRGEYEPYGRIFSRRDGNDRHLPLRLPGQEAEQLSTGETDSNGATERSYNIFRWYRPNWGRYTQPDPIGTVGRENPLLSKAQNALRRPERHSLFVYALDRPTVLVDPLGLSPCGEFLGPNDPGACGFKCARNREVGLCLYYQQQTGHQLIDALGVALIPISIGAGVAVAVPPTAPVSIYWGVGIGTAAGVVKFGIDWTIGNPPITDAIDATFRGCVEKCRCLTF